MGREENVLKKLTVVYIQEDLTLRYTTRTLNPKNNTHAHARSHKHTHTHYLFISYTWNVCNFNLTYEIFLPKQKYLHQITSLQKKKKKSKSWHV